VAWEAAANGELMAMPEMLDPDAGDAARAVALAERISAVCSRVLRGISSS
jgi:hypothetical protein